MRERFPSHPPESIGKHTEKFEKEIKRNINNKNANNSNTNNNNNDNNNNSEDKNKQIILYKNTRKRFTPLKINGKINQIDTPVVIDTGAAVSVIDHDFYQRLPSKLPITKCFRTITDAQNNFIDVVGEVTIFLSIGLTKFKVILFVVRNLSHNILIGNDNLTAWGITIDYKLGYLWTDHRTFFKFNTEEEYKNCGEIICTIEDIMLPARSNIFVKGFIKCHPCGRFVNSSDEMVIEQLDKDNHNFLVTRSISNTSINPTINIVNYRDTPLFIKRGTSIAISYSNNDTKIYNLNIENDKRNEEIEELKEIEFDINPDLTIEQQNKLRSLLHEYSDLFNENISDETTNLGEHSINTRDAIPTKVIYNRNSYKENEVIKSEIENMLKLKIIRPSRSEWTAPVVLVKKKDGSIRFCVDFRKLNNVTVKEIYPLPRINDTIDTLSGMKYFTTLDFISGYWQINIKEGDKHKTAFNTKFGSFEFNRMPFGLSNAPYTFQRIMDVMLTGFKWINCLVYLDDIIIFSHSFENHLNDIRSILVVIRNVKLKLKSKKCRFGFTRINYLGHIISDKGIEIDYSKLEPIKRIKKLYSVKEVKSFLGLANYYRRFIKDFSIIAYPLNRLTTKEAKTFEWNQQAQDALDELKLKLCSTPILAYPNFNDKFLIQTDACKFGYGAVLSQVIDGKEHVISYYSRSTTEREKNYDSREAECAAIIAGVKHYRSYLFGSKFDIVTDHEALKYLQTSKQLSSKLTRWSLYLQDFDFEVIYREQRKHKNADALSRLTLVDKIENLQSEINVIDDKIKSIESFVDGADIIINDKIDKDEDFENIIQKEMCLLQYLDPQIKIYIDYLKKKILTDDQKINNNIISHSNFFVIENDILYHIDHQTKNKKKRNYLNRRVVLPKSLISTILDYYHDYELSGHLCFDKTYLKIKERYYWENMYNDIKDYIKSCETCTAYHNRYLNEQELQVIKSDYPWQTLIMDFEGPLPTTEQNNTYILVITDHYSNYVEAFPVQDITSKITAKILFNHIFCKYGSPEVIISDRGTHFTASIITELCELMQTQKKFSTAYHPQTNGKVERFNRTILSMLAKYCGEHNSTWDKFLHQLVFAYNTSKHASTGESPYCVIYGREARTPLDVISNSNPISSLPVDKYVLHLRDELNKIWKYVDINKRVHNDYNIKYQKKKVRKKSKLQYKIGDKILVYFPQIPVNRNRKFYSKWKGPYKILQLDGLNCKVENCMKEGEVSDVHLSRTKPYFDPTNLNFEFSETKTTELKQKEIETNDDQMNIEITKTNDKEGEIKKFSSTEVIDLMKVSDENEKLCDSSLSDIEMEDTNLKIINNNVDQSSEDQIKLNDQFNNQMELKDQMKASDQIIRKSKRSKKRNKFLEYYIVSKTKGRKERNLKSNSRARKNSNEKKKYQKEDGKEYEVGSILDKKIEDGEEYYLVKFKGFTNSFNLWLPKRNLNCNELIYQFERTQI